MAENYCGNREAFLYVYLSRADESAGRALIDALLGAGHRLYVSSAFTAKDVRILKKAAVAILMMSSATVDELAPVVTAATKEDKPLIPVYLDSLTLPAGMRLLLGPKQAHARQSYADDTAFAAGLLASPVLRELQVTPAQKRAARGLLIGAIALAAAGLAALLLTLGRSGAPTAGIAEGSLLSRLGLSGDASQIESVCLYGTALRGGFEEYGAQDLGSAAENGAPGIYLPEEDATEERGTLTDAADFAQLVNLKELALSGNAFEDLTPLWGLTGLRSLDLSCNLAPISLEGISALTELETLNVAYCKLSGGLEELSQLPRLQTLTVSSDYLDALAPLSARGVRVLCPSVVCPDWETLQTWAPYEHVYELILSGSVTIPEGETLTVRKNVRFSAELGSQLDNRGTVELFGTWEMGMTAKNNYGAVTVRPGGLYAGGMGNSRNYGDFTVDAGGTLEIERGEQFYLEGGTLTVDGALRVSGGGALHWNGGAVVNNGTIETDAAERYFDEMLSGRLADIRGDGVIKTGPEAPEETPAAAPEAADAFAGLPSDPNDLASLDEYGMTPRERAYYDTYEFRSPTWSGGSEVEALVPYVDGDACMVTPSENATAYLARSMTLPHQPLWFDGFAHLVVAPGATVTLGGDDWDASLALTVLPGGTLIVDGDVMFQMAYNSNAGTVIVNGRLYAEAPSWGNKWGMFGSSGAVTVNGIFTPSQFYRFAGGTEAGEIGTEEIFDMTDMAAPVQFAHGYHGMWQFAIFYDHQEVDSMWWLAERDDRIAELPSDPKDADSLDEHGMTPRERAYFDTVHFLYPNWGNGTVERPLTPYVDAETLHVSQPVGCEAYLARDMTVQGQPLWADGFAELFIAPGATVTLGGDWTTSLALTVLPGGTLIVDGDVMFQMAYNAGTVIVNGRLYGEAESYGILWGMFGNSGTVTVNGTFAPAQLFRFAGSQETGALTAGEVLDFTDMAAPLQFANGYRSLALFAQLVNEGNEAEMWWKR